MTDSTIRITSCLFCAVAMFATPSIGTDIPQRWVLQELSHPDAYSFSISDLNDAGDATGSINAVDPDILYQPYILEDGVIHIIPTSAYWTKGYRINESGLGVGIDIDSDHALHYSVDGITDLGYIADLFGSYIYMYAMNESGQFTGYRPLGAGVFQAFTWDSKMGVVHITPDQTHSYALDINDHGQVVGYYTSGGSSTAFLYEDGVRTDFGQAWSGSTKALAIDNDGRILIRQYIAGITSCFMVDSTDFSSVPVAYFGNGEANNIEAVVNESGQVAFSWNTHDGSSFVGYLGWWSHEDGFVELEVPYDSIGIMLVEVNESGWILGSSHDSDYNLQTFVTSINNELHILDDRIIGHESIFMVTASDMNASGQVGTMLNFWSGEDMTVILTPARPGDADGDGLVNVQDLLLVIAEWGPWPEGSECGPDLDVDGDIDVNDLLLCIGDWG